MLHHNLSFRAVVYVEKFLFSMHLIFPAVANDYLLFTFKFIHSFH
jgi:hypothetical protein